VASPEEMKAAFERHRTFFNAGKRQEWLDNFVDVPFLEEPVGTPVRNGREHPAAVFDMVVQMGLTAVIEEPSRIICGTNNEMAVSFVANASGPDGPVSSTPVIEIFTIADDGRIAGIRAFVDPADIPS
jgi:steroid Delta-isomerase